MKGHDRQAAAPLLSVVICTCNRSGCLSDCLESLARSAAFFTEPWEVIVVDNRSTDRTATMLGAWITAGRLPLTADAIGGWVGLHDDRDAAVSIRIRPDACWIDDVTSALAALIGCNFSIRASALRQVGDFDERLGAGSPARSAEDLDLFHRLLRAGARLRYDPSIKIHHAHGRRDPTEVRRGYLIGRGAGSPLGGHSAPGARAMASPRESTSPGMRATHR